MTADERVNIRHYLKSKQDKTRKRIDGEKVRCEECSSTSELEWHHIIPFSKGGTDEPENLKVLCQLCHKLYHKESDDYRRNGQWGGLVSAYLREQKLGREKFCEEMQVLARKRWAA